MQSSNPIDSIGRNKKPFDIFGVVKRYFVFVAVFGSVLFLCLSPMAFILSKPYYHANGRILIERVMEPSISRTENTPISNFFYDYAQTEVQRIVHDSVLKTALENLPQDAQDQYAPHGPTPSSIAALRNSLTVGLIPSTHIIMVQLNSGAPVGIAEAVNAIMEAYLNHAQEIEENKDSRRLTFLLEERAELQRKLEGLTAQLTSLATDTRTSTFVETYNTENHKLLELQELWIASRAKRIELENKLNETKTKIHKIRKLPTDSLADELVSNDESLWSISYWTYKTLQEMRASIDGVDPRNPDRKYIEERMLAMQEYESNLKNKVEERAERIVDDKRDYELEKELIAIEAEYEAARNTEKQLHTQLAEARTESASNSRKIIKGQQVSASLAHLRDRLNDIENRIQEIRAEAKTPLRVSIEQLAQKPDGPAGDNKKKLLILCFIAAFGIIGFPVLVVEFSDSRIRSSKDIVHATDHPPSWPISEWKGEAPVHMLLAMEPHSRISRAMRSLAIRINNERIRNNSQIAVFAGVGLNVGTSSIICNTAYAMSSFCSKVLVIETVKGPNSISNMFAIDSDGISECLLHNDKIRTCIHKSKDLPFDILPTGEEVWANNQNDTFGVILDSLKQQYDFIFIDAAPILQSDKTEFLLLKSDISALVIQGDKTQYNALRQALEIVLRMKVPSIITVLNWGAPRALNSMEKILSKMPDIALRFIMPSLVRIKSKK